jgi:hypothetical protein
MLNISVTSTLAMFWPSCNCGGKIWLGLTVCRYLQILISLNFNFKLKRFSGARIWSASHYHEFLGARRSLPQILSYAQLYCENAIKCVDT